jgi:hypothetical protein
MQSKDNFDISLTSLTFPSPQREEVKVRDTA